MNILKRKKRASLITALFLIFCFVITAASTGVYAAGISDLNSNFFAGSRSNKREFVIDLSSMISTDGEYYTVTMDIENPGGDFSGYARVGVDYNDSLVGYDVDISIPKGSTKTYSITVPKKAANGQDTVQVTIYDKNDKAQYAEKFKSVFSQKNVLNTGILADDPDSLSFLDNGGKKVEYSGVRYPVKLTYLDANTLADSLPTIRILVINDYDTSTLSEETIGSIKRWVDDGGMLVLGTGENAQRVLSGFNNYDSGFVNAR